MADLQDPSEASALGTIPLDGALAGGPPEPDTPEARIRAWTDKYGPYRLTQEQLVAAWAGRPLPPPAD